MHELGIEKNTLALFFSDNGAAKNEGGSSGGLKAGNFKYGLVAFVRLQ
ncbi:hypothetical protein [Arachidicoccus soli]|nr:hypothetical protein [Arachidicoccus soli]